MKLKIIGLLGKAKSGKDTAGTMLQELGGGVPIAFADRLKEICMEMFELPREAFYTDEGKNAATEFPCLVCPTCASLEAREIVLDGNKCGQCDLCGSIGDVEVFRGFWKNRMIMQHIGTKGFRTVHPHVWARKGVQRAAGLLADGAPFVAITDVRFHNEAEHIWAKGGEVWRIKRPGLTDDAGGAGLKNHASEVEQDDIKDGECQAVIENNSTLDALRSGLSVQLQRFLGRDWK